MKKTLFMLVSCITLLSLAGCGKIENNGQDAQTVSAMPAETAQADSNPEVTAASSAEPVHETLTADVGYADPEREIAILGLKEYKKLKSDVYTDKPKKGKKFLVLFMKIRNRSYKEEYINVSNLSAKLDGEEIETGVLVNQPKNYPTLFQSIPSETDTAGFIVWEVPGNWKKLQVSYDGWKYSDNVILNMEFTPEDLSAPPKFDNI